MIKEKSSLVKEIQPSQQLPQNNFSVEGILRAGLLYSVVTFQDNIVICDTGKIKYFPFVLIDELQYPLRNKSV